MTTQINPNQIRPATVNGSLLGTVAGTTTQMSLIAGAGIAISLVGNTLVISATGAAPLVIESFTGSQTVELGASVVNPSFAATYSATPTSANITNTDSIDSPHTLTTPFTAATLAGTFMHTVIATVNFLLSAALGTDTETATQAIAWEPAIFAGIGAPGATSSVTASGTTAVLSTSDVLVRTQLGAETVGEQFGPFTGMTGQSLYLLLIGATHNFIDANTSLAIPFNAPTTVTFVNAHGVTVTMHLYQSTNILYGASKPEIAS